MTATPGLRQPAYPPGPPKAAGESNPVNQVCALCGAPTGGTGLLCAGCVTLPTGAGR